VAAVGKFAGKMRPAFTIIEMTLTTCIVCIIAAIATPRLGSVIDAIEVRQASLEVQTFFSSARHMAIAKGAQASVEIDTARRLITLRVGSDTVRKRELGLEHQVELRATRSGVTYSPNGVGYGAANVTVVIKRNAATDSVIVSRLGRVRH